MAAPTSRLGLTRDDGTDNYSVTRVNANSDKIDEAIGSTACTSTTRPSSNLFDGRLAYESDTDAIVVYKTTGTTWRYATTANVANQTARDALSPKHDGLQCYRKDRDWVEIYQGSVWRVQGVAICTNFSDLSAITNPTNGQRAVTTDYGIEWVYYASAWTQSPYRVGGEFRANANKSIVTGANKMQFQTTLVNNSITVITNDGFQVPVDGLYAMTGFVKFAFTVPTSAGLSFGGVSYGGTGSYSGDQFGSSASDVHAAATRYLAASTIVCAYVYSNDATTRNTDIGTRPHEFAIWKVG